MARVLIVGGGCRGRGLAGALVGAGHAVRVTTRAQEGAAAIEAVGASAWIGTPDRLMTLREALDGVTVACWLLGGASGDAEAVAALHGERLEAWLRQVIDTTVRGVVYEASGSVGAGLLQGGADMVRAACAGSSIPFVLLHADPADGAAWLAQAGEAVNALLSGEGPGVA